MSHCASLEFHRFNVSVLNHINNCTFREVRLLLELRWDEQKEDSVYLDACITGRNDNLFWHCLTCNTTAEGGGGGSGKIDFVTYNVNLNETYPHSETPSTATDVLPGWAIVVIVILAIALVALSVYVGAPNIMIISTVCRTTGGR